MSVKSQKCIIGRKENSDHSNSAMVTSSSLQLFLLLLIPLLIPLLIHGVVESSLAPTLQLRRILHQPLDFSTPPQSPSTESTPPSPMSNQPFFKEAPAAPPQVEFPPPPTINSSTALPAATQPAAKPGKKVAISVSVGIATLGMLSALVFFVYRHRAKNSEKHLGGNSQSVTDGIGRPPPPSLLYPMDPHQSDHRRSELNGVNLNLVKRLDRDQYRPSPELRPLPPLTKGCSPSQAMSSSDDDYRESTFHTPSAMSSSNSTVNDDNFYRPFLRPSNGTSSIAEKLNGDVSVSSSVPQSKRTSPKSRFTPSPAHTKEQPPDPPPLPPRHRSQRNLVKEQITPLSSKAKIPAPPPPPNMGIVGSLNNSTPPPAPPPPPLPPRKGAAQPRPRKLCFYDTVDSATRSHSPEKLQPQIPQNDKNTTSLEEALILKDGNCSENVEADGIEQVVKPKLKPLHWDKVRATSDRATVWDQLKSGSFQLNEGMMESLFGCNSNNIEAKGATKKSGLPPVEQENRVLDPKKSQNIAILLRALNVTRDEVAEALSDGNPEGLGSELLETLVKMAPTKEEEIKLRDYNTDITKLGSAERFLKAILDIPFAFKRVEVMLYRDSFDAEVNYLRKSYQTLEAASEELKKNRLFLKLLQAVLRAGNRMNVGTNRGDAKAFKLDTLLKLIDIKGTDGKTTLLHFVVQEMIKSEGVSPNHGLQVVAGLSRELSDVKRAAGMDSDVLSSYVLKLEDGLEKVRVVLPNVQGKFFESMKAFLKEADLEIAGIKGDERKALKHVKEVTEYFHGNAAKEEAHPLRIFMIVRDFLSILDLVCKEVGIMQEKAVGTGRSFRMSSTAPLPVLNRFQTRQGGSSSDDGSSSSP